MMEDYNKYDCWGIINTGKTLQFFSTNYNETFNLLPIIKNPEDMKPVNGRYNIKLTLEFNGDE